MKQTNLNMVLSDKQYRKLETEIEILNSVIDDLDSIFQKGNDDVKQMFFEIGKIHSHLQTSWADMQIIMDDINHQNQ
jgi:hypothetical protein